MKNRVEVFLEDMTYNSKFRIMENAKDNDKLKEIAEKRGIILPAHDLAPFECIYGFVDRQNKNGCTLPKEEVNKALGTLIGKAIDFDHFRKRVVGHWIDAKLEGDKIIAYGVFYKGNFGEDYIMVKDMMDKDVLAISFEAWGDREVDMGSDGYDLTKIEFAGGALLIKTEPAFDGAEVLELAQKERVLEFAKVMTKPDKFVYTDGHKEEKKENLEEARYFVHDMDMIQRLLGEVPCKGCDERYALDVDVLDFAKNQAKVRCLNCEAESMVDLTPASKITKKGRKIKAIAEIVRQGAIDDVDSFIKDYEGSSDRLSIHLENSIDSTPYISFSNRIDLTDEDFAVVKQINEEKGTNKKIRMFPIHNSAHINMASDKLKQPKVASMLGKLSITIDKVEGKILRRANKLAMDELIKKLKESSVEEVLQELAKASLDRELTVEELEKAYTIVEYEKPAGDQNATSLLNVPTKKSSANETSLINAEDLTEDKLKDVITQATTPAKKKEKAKVVDKDETEVAELKTKLEEAIKKLEEATKKLEDFEKAKVGDLVKARKDELGDVAKDMSDEDLLDDHKFELAKKDKEIADLKAGSTTKKKPDLAKGSTDKDIESDEQASRQKVDSYFLKPDAEAK